MQLNREHRLYQADWLMRFYRFDASELTDEAHPMLDLEVDPKANWALNHLECFPVEVNTAPLEMLLRVPGIGPKGARHILKARKTCCLREPELRRLGITFKRARYFITCNGFYMGAGTEFAPEPLRACLRAPIDGGSHGARAAKVPPGSGPSSRRRLSAAAVQGSLRSKGSRPGWRGPPLTPWRTSWRGLGAPVLSRRWYRERGGGIGPGQPGAARGCVAPLWDRPS